MVPVKRRGECIYWGASGDSDRHTPARFSDLPLFSHWWCRVCRWRQIYLSLKAMVVAHHTRRLVQVTRQWIFNRVEAGRIATQSEVASLSGNQRATLKRLPSQCSYPTCLRHACTMTSRFPSHPDDRGGYQGLRHMLRSDAEPDCLALQALFL